MKSPLVRRLTEAAAVLPASADPKADVK